MTNGIHISGFFGAAAVLAVTFYAPVAQAQPTEAQRDAVRSACRSDYMANCSSVPPGGAESLQCLQRNEGKLSGACRSAVNAISASAKPAEPAAPAAAASAPAAAPEKPTAAKPAAPKPVTASAPPASAGTTTEPAKRTTSAPKTTAPKATASAPAAAPADTGPPPAPPPLPLGQIPPRFELAVVRSCRYETRTICALPAGGGRILNCLAANQASVSAGCSDALDRARAAAR